MLPFVLKNTLFGIYLHQPISASSCVLRNRGIFQGKAFFFVFNLIQIKI